MEGEASTRCANRGLVLSYYASVISLLWKYAWIDKRAPYHYLPIPRRHMRGVEIFGSAHSFNVSLGIRQRMLNISSFPKGRRASFQTVKLYNRSHLPITDRGGINPPIKLQNRDQNGNALQRCQHARVSITSPACTARTNPSAPPSDPSHVYAPAGLSPSPPSPAEASPLLSPLPPSACPWQRTSHIRPRA